MMWFVLLIFLNLNFAGAEELVAPTIDPLVDEASLVHYQGIAGYAIAPIDHAFPGHQGWLGLTSIKDEILQPGVRLDFLKQFNFNELKISISELLRNRKKQTLRGEAFYSPEGKIFPRWGAELVGTAPVYGRPIDLSLGFRYSSFLNSSVALIFPGFNSYFLNFWKFSATVLGSKVKASTVNNSKWLLGFKVELTRFYGLENTVNVFFSKNEESIYNPILLDYSVVPVSTVGILAQHWFNPQLGIAPSIKWQRVGLASFRNWYTLSTSLIFRI